MSAALLSGRRSASYSRMTWLRRIPQGGVQVTDISLDDLEEVSALRTVLEVYAVELACEKITDQEISKLES